MSQDNGEVHLIREVRFGCCARARASNIALVRGGLAWVAPLFSIPTLFTVGHFNI